MRVVALALLGLYTASGGGYTLTDSDEAGGPPFAWDDISSAPEVPFPGIDDQQMFVTLPFTFTYFGQAFTTVSVCTNGFLQFGGFASTAINQAVPSATSPNGLVAVFWDDLIFNAGTSVRTQTIGAAPERRFIVSWNGIQQLGGATSLTFQVALFETTNVIRMQYLTMTGAAPSATIGIENAGGSTGVSYLFGASPSGNLPSNLLAIEYVPAPAPPSPPPGPVIVDDDDDADIRCTAGAAGASDGVAALGLASLAAFALGFARRV